MDERPRQRRPIDPHRRRAASAATWLAAAAALLAGCAATPATSPVTTSSTAAPAGACAAASTAFDYAAAAPLRRVRIYTDPATGDSAFEDSLQPPKRTPLLKTGKILDEYDFGRAGKVQIVVAPGDLDLPLHAAPYRESFLILQGSVTMRLADGTRRDLQPGDMTVFEDTGARTGHGGRTGPCGYVALNIVPDVR